MQKWMALATLLLVAACISPEEQAAIDAAQRQADMQECQSIGFRPYTTAFGDCVLRLKEIRAQQENTDALIDASAPQPWPYYGPYRHYPHW